MIVSLMSLCEKQSGSFSRPSRTLRHSHYILHTVYWTSVQLAFISVLICCVYAVIVLNCECRQSPLSVNLLKTPRLPSHIATPPSLVSSDILHYAVNHNTARLSLLPALSAECLYLVYSA